MPPHRMALLGWTPCRKSLKPPCCDGKEPITRQRTGHHVGVNLGSQMPWGHWLKLARTGRWRISGDVWFHWKKSNLSLSYQMVWFVFVWRHEVWEPLGQIQTNLWPFVLLDEPPKPKVATCRLFHSSTTGHSRLRFCPGCRVNQRDRFSPIMPL